jgi:hypothetical protein
MDLLLRPDDAVGALVEFSAIAVSYEALIFEGDFIRQVSILFINDFLVLCVVLSDAVKLLM